MLSNLPINGFKSTFTRSIAFLLIGGFLGSCSSLISYDDSQLIIVGAFDLTEEDFGVLYQEEKLLITPQSDIGHGVTIQSKGFRTSIARFSKKSLEPLEHESIDSSGFYFSNFILRPFEKANPYQFDIAEQCKIEGELCARLLDVCGYDSIKIVNFNRLLQCGGKLVQLSILDDKVSVDRVSSVFTSTRNSNYWIDGYVFSSATDATDGLNSLLLLDGKIPFSIYSDNGTILSNIYLTPSSCPLEKIRLKAARYGERISYILLSCVYRGGMQLFSIENGVSSLIFETPLRADMYSRYLILSSGVVYEVGVKLEEIHVNLLNPPRDKGVKNN